MDIEGLDGCGQSTQIQLLVQRLARLGTSAVLTKEPAEDCLSGPEIRQILKKEKPAPKNQIELQKMFVANRKDHLQKVIIPALADGKMVITDRYFWSTVAFVWPSRN